MISFSTIILAVVIGLFIYQLIDVTLKKTLFLFANRRLAKKILASSVKEIDLKDFLDLESLDYLIKDVQAIITELESKHDESLLFSISKLNDWLYSLDRHYKSLLRLMDQKT